MAIGFTLLVVLAIIIAIYVIIEIKRMKHKLFAIFLIVLIIFFYASAVVVFKGENINFKSVDGLETATKLYFSWLGSFFGNVQAITSNAIKMDWGSNPPRNSTLSE